MPAREELVDMRKRLNQALEDAGDGDAMKALAEAALAIKKRVRHQFNCKFCAKPQQQWVEIADTVAATTALEKLLNQAKGRPTDEQPDDGVSVEYNVYVVSSKEEAEALIAGE